MTARLRESASLHADAGRLRLSQAQAPVLTVCGAEIVVVTGPPGSGKTTALAAYAQQCEREGRNTVVVCAHEEGVSELRDALEQMREDWDPQAAETSPAAAATMTAVGMLADHAAAWMRRSYVSARVAPDLCVGPPAAAEAIVARAARGLLDMSWPIFASGAFNLDLPHLSRPDAFLREAASLFTLLQRSRVSPEEFEAGCASGMTAFYGRDVERAAILLQDPQLRERLSKRGREACRASNAALGVQRAAERDVAAILAQLYREYLTVATAAPIRTAEDILDAALRWLNQSEDAAASVRRRVDCMLVDDAEDAEPALGAIVAALRRPADLTVVLAGWEPAAVAGFEGRRSALEMTSISRRIQLPPREAASAPRVARLDDERTEVEWLAKEIGALLDAGERPETIALLCRTEDAAFSYARSLRAYGLPVSVPPDAFEDQAELLDLLSLCAIVEDPLDPEHLLRVAASPLLGLSDATISRLCREPADGRQLTLPIADAQADLNAGKSAHPMTFAKNLLLGEADGFVSEETADVLGRFRLKLAAWRMDCAASAPVGKFAHLMKAGGFHERWQQSPAHYRSRLLDDANRVAETLVSATRGDEALPIRDIIMKLEEESLPMRRARRTSGAVATDGIAQAKGCRWRHVFVAGVAHERFPRIYASHAMAFSRAFGLIIRENVARGAAQTAKFAWYYAKFGAKAMYLEEERRALRYGLSRGVAGSAASGFGSAPRWASDQDLLASLAREHDGGEASTANAPIEASAAGGSG
ncbi:MAG: 3'-5' exonuclease [Candidatus Eremiobacter antarcticus]|nr:AAA family ATPase [Candidatus Eremiobacteraeota bacterium]MBC5809126.1 AAA family ATPase [Candidatus Eremiobacteraeota bacterium]